MRRCAAEKVFFKILQNLQENTCARVFFLINLIEKRDFGAGVFFCEFCEIFKKTFFYRTPPVSDSEMHCL